MNPARQFPCQAMLEHRFSSAFISRPGLILGAFPLRPRRDAYIVMAIVNRSSGISASVLDHKRNTLSPSYRKATLATKDTNPRVKSARRIAMQKSLDSTLLNNANDTAIRTQDVALSGASPVAWGLLS